MVQVELPPLGPRTVVHVIGPLGPSNVLTLTLIPKKLKRTVVSLPPETASRSFSVSMEA